jgi:hypothetical protein
MNHAGLFKNTNIHINIYKKRNHALADLHITGIVLYTDKALLLLKEAQLEH